MTYTAQIAEMTDWPAGGRKRPALNAYDQRISDNLVDTMLLSLMTALTPAVMLAESKRGFACQTCGELCDHDERMTREDVTAAVWSEMPADTCRNCAEDVIYECAWCGAVHDGEELADCSGARLCGGCHAEVIERERAENGYE